LTWKHVVPNKKIPRILGDGNCVGDAQAPNAGDGKYHLTNELFIYKEIQELLSGMNHIYLE
jgi:hypothetical protein